MTKGEKAGHEGPGVPAPRYDLRILVALRRIIRYTELYSRWLAAEHEITGPQLICLSSLVENPGLTASALADEVYLSPSTVVGILRRLEEKGLIARERDSRDRRVVNIRLTDAGQRLVADGPSTLQHKLHEGLAVMPDLEQATIALALERVVKLMEADELQSEPMVESGALEQSAESQALASEIEKKDIEEV